MHSNHCCELRVHGAQFSFVVQLWINRNELVIQNVDESPSITDVCPSIPVCMHFYLQSDDREDGLMPAGYQWLIEDDEVDDINVVGAGAHQDAAVYCADADLMEQKAKKVEWYILRVDYGAKSGR